jgi:hypothetical protein
LRGAGEENARDPESLSRETLEPLLESLECAMLRNGIPRCPDVLERGRLGLSVLHTPDHSILL